MVCYTEEVLMKLNDYIDWLAKNPKTMTLTYEQSCELCEDISKTQASDIPKEFHCDIEDLLVERLNSNAVDRHLVAPLEILLTSLREE